MLELYKLSYENVTYIIKVFILVAYNVPDMNLRQLSTNNIPTFSLIFMKT